MRAVLYERLDPVLPDGDAMLRIAEAFGSYAAFSVESIEDEGRSEEPPMRVARSQYFREEYAYDDFVTAGIEPFLHHASFLDGARKVHGRPIVRPDFVHANFLIPGQELTLHTDVPEFRGLSRRKDPQWLSVAAHHSGLFDRWRTPIATAVAWFGRCRGGGDFVFYPDGVYDQAVALPALHNTAIVLDTDSVFHGVDRVSEQQVALPPLGSGATLQYAGGGRWQVRQDDETLATYEWDDLRFSVSWKAHCYADEAEERAATEHTDDLTRAQVLETLEADLRKRGALETKHPSENELVMAIIEGYIQFPPVTAS
jgi:hypothetical protein